MNNKPITYPLIFNGFSLEFDVWEELSVEWTKGFTNYPDNFVFVVAETYLKVGSVRYLIETKDMPPNFNEAIGRMANSLLNPIVIPHIENIIDCGGLRKWMRVYWNKIDIEAVTDNDEALYDSLIASLIIDTKEGQIFVYQYNGIQVIEVVAFTDNKEVVFLWSEFNPKIKYQETKNLQHIISASVCDYLKSQGA